MKKNSIIGYTIAIFSGLLIVGSAFFSLTMMLVTGQFKQGNSLFDYFFGGVKAVEGMNLPIIVYGVAIMMAVVCIVFALIGLICTIRGKRSKLLLTMERIASLLCFIAIILSLITLGLHIATQTYEGVNIMGIGLLVALLGSLLLIEGMFLVRVRETKKSEEN